VSRCDHATFTITLSGVNPEYGFLTFLHEPSLTWLVDRHQVPPTLLRFILACVFLFADEEHTDNEKRKADVAMRMARSEQVFQPAFRKIKEEAFEAYGAVELMSVLLARTYQRARGRFAAAEMLTGMAMQYVPAQTHSSKH